MSFDPEQITLFAKTDARGREVPFGIKAKDRTRHVYVIGKTGMGKSTLLENMAVQDIRNGNGLAFIDPHGQTAETLLDYIPEERKDDVLYFAPHDTDNPVSFNVMEDVDPDKRHLVVSGLMSVFKKIFVDQWSARMEYILSNTLLALLEYPDSTLLGVNRMLSDKVYRKKVIANISDPAVKSFWVDEFLNYNERYMQEAGDAIKNKIGQFTANPLIRNIIGQPKSSFDIRQIMDDRKILIMNLSKGLIGETNANLLGSMLTTRIYLAAMSRADLQMEDMKKMPNFYFYVDEFQSFANATFADILSEARKYKLNLTIAHQYIEQMEEEVRNAVFGNVGTIISFRVGPFDAEVLETVYSPQFLATDLVNLGFAQIYLTLMIDGIGSQPFSATTLPPIEPAEISYKHIAINKSRENFSHPRPGVEEAINKWHEPMVEERPQRNQNNAGGSKQNHKPNANQGHHSNGNRPGSGNNARSAPPQHSNRNNNQEHRANTNSKKEFEHKKPQSDGPKVPKGKSLDELRDVLKGISNSDKDKEEKRSKQKESRVEHNGKKREESKGDLRVLLQKTLGEQPAGQKKEAAKNHEKSHVKEQKKTNNSDTHRGPESKKQKVEVRPQPQHQQARAVTEPAPAQEEAKQHTSASSSKLKHRESAEPLVGGKPGDPLDPKKLERMMRVNQSENSPLK